MEFRAFREQHPVIARTVSGIAIGALSLGALPSCDVANLPPRTPLYRDSELLHRCGSSGPDMVHEGIHASRTVGDIKQAVRIRSPGGDAADNCPDEVWISTGDVTVTNHGPG